MQNDGPATAIATLKPKTAVAASPELLARAWVERAIASDCDPFARQEPLSSEDAGEWRIVTRRASVDASPPLAKLPDELWDEAFIVLAAMGRLKHDNELRFWHGNLLLDDCSPRAMALRLKMARQSLHMDCGQFYDSCGINRMAAEGFEAGHPSFASPSSEILERLCARHGMPEAWLKFGVALEMEA